MQQLLFSPLAKRWLVQIGDGLWKVERRLDALTLAGFLPLEVDSGGADEAGMPRGVANVVSEGPGECCVQLTELGGKRERFELHLSPAAVSSGSIEWVEGFFADGWLSTDAALAVEGVEAVGVRTFLPEWASGPAEKSVELVLDGHPLGELKVRRAQVEETWISMPCVDRRRHMLSLRSAYPEANPSGGDQRLLGFVVVALNLDRTEWTPAERFA